MKTNEIRYSIIIVFQSVLNTMTLSPSVSGEYKPLRPLFKMDEPLLIYIILLTNTLVIMKRQTFDF